MIIKKFVTGCVIQEYDTEKKRFVSQAFKPKHDMWVNEDQEVIDQPKDNSDFHFDMVQPLPTLLDRFPDIGNGEFNDTEAYKYLNEDVLRVYETHITPWPGMHKNIHVFCLLQNGKLVGFNENPARGWSFPVMKAPEWWEEV